jgi:hypothetical protein
MGNCLDSNLIAQYLTQEKLDAYGRDLENWLEKYNLRNLLGPADHFAIKIPTEKILLALVEAIEPFCIEDFGDTPGLSVRRMDNRSIAVALLEKPLYMGSTEIYCLEIMQSKPENIDTDVVGLDHLEFINTNFEGVQSTLKAKDVEYGINVKNGYKKTVIVKINRQREEVKFTDKTLAQVVPLQIHDDPRAVRIIKS